MLIVVLINLIITLTLNTKLRQQVTKNKRRKNAYTHLWHSIIK